MLDEKDYIIKRTIILLDSLIVLLSFIFAYFIRQNIHTFYRWNLFPSQTVLEPTIAQLNDYLLVIFLVVPLWCLMMYVNGMYESTRVRKYHEILWIIFKSSILVSLIFGLFVFLLKLTFVSRILFVIFMTISSLSILLEKTILYFIIRHRRRRGYNFNTLLVIGTGTRAINFIQRIKKHPEWGFRIIGVLDDEPGRGIQKVDTIEVIGSLDDISDILRNQSIDEVIFVVPRSRLNHMQEAIFACETVGISTSIAVDLFDLKIAKAHVSNLDGLPLVRHITTMAPQWGLFIKRFIDIFASGFVLTVMFPVFVLIGILIKITSKGPIFFKQERLGLNGRKFTLFKFRTMYQGAHKELRNGENIEIMHTPQFKKKKKKWITPLGRLLRRFSFDEIPQFINVFIGNMSLVGPRPTVLEEVSQYVDWQRRRFSMKPGLTCLWQIKGRNKLSHKEWMKLDLEYLDNWSLWLDFKILLKTIPVVLFGIGAY
jgi:exopolysaccharide biosynthesis polyprenyl glycosylphosphotransferase